MVCQMTTNSPLFFRLIPLFFRHMPLHSIQLCPLSALFHTMPPPLCRLIHLGNPGSPSRTNFQLCYPFQYFPNKSRHLPSRKHEAHHRNLWRAERIIPHLEVLGLYWKITYVPISYVPLILFFYDLLFFFSLYFTVSYGCS